MFQIPSLIGKTFLLAKIAQKVRDCSELYVLFIVAKSPTKQAEIKLPSKLELRKKEGLRIVKKNTKNK
jgi:hypothetical protein